jgi:23S rRNA (cytosine1962-C5)-methyltransferase
MANTIPELQLHPSKMASLQRRHHWIFSGALRPSSIELKAGDWVYVSVQGNIVASGFYNPGSIAVRVVCFEQREPSLALFKDILGKGIALRTELLSHLLAGTNAFRLFHGEGDGLPGLVIDSYNGHLVVQAHHEGIDAQRHLICAALQELLSPPTLFWRQPYLKEQGTGQWMLGECEGTEIVEHGLSMSVDWVHGQKTGLFLDQRDNRHLLSLLSKGKRVLNCFCYEGGFSLAALQGGSEHVVSVDVSERAIEATTANVRKNFPQAEHEGICADVMEYLKHQSSDFDFIVLDPPAFAKGLKSRHKAIQAYRRLNALGMKALKKPGFLMTYSCSAVVDEVMFRQAVFAAALDAQVSAQVLQKLGQPSDHPTNLFHQETSYLKGLLLYILP